MDSNCETDNVFCWVRSCIAQVFHSWATSNIDVTGEITQKRWMQIMNNTLKKLSLCLSHRSIGFQTSHPRRQGENKHQLLAIVQGVSLVFRNSSSMLPGHNLEDVCLSILIRLWDTFVFGLLKSRCWWYLLLIFKWLIRFYWLTMKSCSFKYEDVLFLLFLYIK